MAARRTIVPRSAGRRLAAVLAAAVGLLVPVAVPPAAAEDPVELSTDGQVTDLVGVLDDGERAEVDAALERLRDAEAVQLFVAYVDDFGELGREAWADETAELSGLGRDDVLLAVAVEARQYRLSVDGAFPVDDDAIDDLLADEVEPELADDDWAGAAVAMADGLREELDGGRSDDGGGGGLGWLVPVLIGLAVVGGVLLFLRRRRRDAAPPGPVAPDAPVDPWAGTSTEDLRTRAAAALVEVDDALETSAADVAFAEGEFGAEAAAPFRAALDKARAEVAAGFAALADPPPGTPDDDAARRARFVDILERCRRADEALDARVADFEALRDLARRAPEVVARLRAELGAVAARLPEGEAALAELRRAVPESGLTALDDSVVEARARVEAAGEALDDADADLAEGRPNEAALEVHGAEEALAQAARLLDGLARARTELAEARAGLERLIGELKAELAGAEAAAEPGAVAAVASVREALAQVEADLADGVIEPVAALARLQEADAQLDQAAAGAREEAQRQQRARDLLAQSLTGARSRLDAVGDLVATRRGAVGAEARTHLAEGERRLAAAVAAQATDPERSLSESQAALQLAESAERAARHDVDDYRRDPYQGSWGRQRSGGSGAGMVLGGILLDSILRGGRGGGWSGGGGFGGGGGRSSGGGGVRSGGFGGSGGRRGGGGRF